MKKLSKDLEIKVEAAILNGMQNREIAKEFGVGHSTITRIRHAIKTAVERRREFDVQGDKAHLTLVTRLHFKSVDEILAYANVDTTVWEPYRHIINSWDVTVKPLGEGPKTVTNWQVKVWLKRKSVELQAAEELLKKVQEHSLFVPRIKRPAIVASKIHRELELSMLDPHIGLRCFKPAADGNQSSQSAIKTFWEVGKTLIEHASVFGPFERIVFPFGHDFFHTDCVYGTTTTGTLQPEADSWKHTLVLGEQAIIGWVTNLARLAPVKVIVVPGNHARHTEILMGRLLNAYFHNNKNVEVDCELSPYKFHCYGVNLIGFEHGHSVRQQLRYAALMANECRNFWNQTVYREWHLGDQHRKASAKPSHFEEQGVSVEFLPGLTTPNEWHRVHGYNWQKRAGMAFVWDKGAGPIARLQVNIDSYTGKVMK